MKLLVSIVLTALLSFVLGIYLPWWSIAVAAFVVAALVPQKPWKSWLSAFVAVAALWGGLAFGINAANQSILLNKISLLFQLNQPLLLILITALIGGLVASVAALAGAYARKNI